MPLQNVIWMMEIISHHCLSVQKRFIPNNSQFKIFEWGKFYISFSNGDNQAGYSHDHSKLLPCITWHKKFYTVPIYEQHKKYLKFLNTGIAYQLEVMPNGYLDAMRVFTKILKPPFSCLREQGHSSVIYVDGSLLAGDTYKDCLDNVHETKLLLEGLCFHIYSKKSVFLPTQVITFVGFEINTVTMTISLVDLIIFTDASNEGWVHLQMIKPSMEDGMNQRNFYI